MKHIIKFLSIFILFLLANCSSYTVVSITSNVATVAATGKTNADMVISLLAGKDCKFYRVTVNRRICKQNNSNIAIKEETIETAEKNNKSDKKIARKIIDTTFYITKNVAIDHAILGAKISDKIGLTNELEEKVKIKFENNKIEKNLSQKPENNIKEKISTLKKDNNNEKNNETTWKQRVEKVKIQKNELVEEVKIQKDELVEEAKVKSKTIIDSAINSAKVQKDELVEEVKVKSKTIIDSAKVQKDELVEEVKVKSKTIIDSAKVQKNELVEEVKVKSKELKENFLKNIKKLKLYSPDTYALSL